MNDTLEQNIRTLFAQDAASYDTAAAITRLTSFDFSARVSRRHRLQAAIGASGTAVLGGIIAAVVLLLSAGTPAAYAGWVASPAAASTGAVATGAAKCAKVGALRTNVFSGTPVLTETRGRYTAAIYVTGDRVYDCLDSGPGGFTITSFEQFGRVGASPGPDLLTAPYAVPIALSDGSIADPLTGVEGSGIGEVAGKLPNIPIAVLRRSHEFPGLQEARLIQGGGYGGYVLGRAGSDVTHVSFAFAHHPNVIATVENGWYFAWWPWTGVPTSVNVTTSSAGGTTTSSSPMQPVSTSPLATPANGCQPGSAGCVFATTTPTETPPTRATPTPSGYSLARLEQTYSILQDDSALSRTPLPAVNLSRPGFERSETQLGLELSGARMAEGSDGYEMWLVPGTSGYCFFNARAGHKHSGGMGCGREIGGLIGSSGSYRSPGSPGSEQLEGFVPNDNPTITITEDNGRSVKLPVKDGAVFAQIDNSNGFNAIEYRNARGKEITEPLGPGS